MFCVQSIQHMSVSKSTQMTLFLNSMYLSLPNAFYRAALKQIMSSFPASYRSLRYNLIHACFGVIFISDCSFPIDIALAIDASGSVGNRSFQLVREFLKLFTQHFDVSHMVRFACLHYDHFVYKDFSFKDEQFRNRTNLEEKLQNMSYPSGATLTHQALIEVIKFFGIGNGARNASEVRRVAVVLTDGRTYGGKRKLIPPVDYLKVRYIYIYVCVFFFSFLCSFIFIVFCFFFLFVISLFLA